jgi:two-component system, OmpR family, phosphate regulon sensor histidine kinase PhoR
VTGTLRMHAMSKRKLLAGLSLLILALAVPTGILIWQAYGQLRSESFHHYRGLAEELTQRIDAELVARITDAESRTFADYSFVIVEGTVESNILQRSPLSVFPATGDLPGVLGYFQVDGDGHFSTPVLPPSGADPASVGISPEEYERRQRYAQQLLSVLSANSLVHSGSTTSVSSERMQEPDALMPPDSRVAPAAFADRRRVAGQAAFDALSAQRDADSAPPEADDRSPVTEPAGEISSTHARTKVTDLGFESPFNDKREEQFQSAASQPQATIVRATRTEQSMLPETHALAAAAPKGVSEPLQLRIDTFESEIDPLEFSLLDSGHFVLFRKVWRDRERYIQGALIDRHSFLENAIISPIRNSVTADMSDLIIAWKNDIIHTGFGAESAGLSHSALESPAALLYRFRLSSPLDSLELIFRARDMPPGPGARVLGWSTLVLAAVFCIAFLSLYRLGSSQIELARQQQDFVSAVSHELKTPLTSIRMYGEMLREGWAEPDKRQQYYEYIHDESERLTRLISNVLQLASITRNAPRLDIRAMSIGQLMRDIEAKVSNQVQRSGFSLLFEYKNEIAQVEVGVDADCFMQIIINLVDNAIKFSRNATPKAIEISSRLASDNSVTFSVRDYGPGVPRDQMKKIFRLFYRSESELTRETVGTGIGLAIVHQLTLAMGGKTDVVNRDPGAEFSISLPRR